MATPIEFFKTRKSKKGRTITKYIGTDSAVEIPREIDGLAVIEIASQAFYFNTHLRQITIPEGVTVIGLSAFHGCTNLTQLTLPDSVTEIGHDAFAGCINLSQLIIPHGVSELKAFTFKGCTSLHTIIVQNSKCKVDKSASENTPALVNLTHISTPVLSSFPLERLLLMAQDGFSTWEFLSQDAQKTILAYVKKKKTLKKVLFQSGEAKTISILMEEKNCLSLDEVNQHLEYTIAQGQTAITAMLLDYKNKHFEQAVQEAHAENAKLVEVGLELPTLKQLKEKWRCSASKNGIRISGYLGTETYEELPSHTKDNKKIYSVVGSKDGHFEPLETLILPEGLAVIEDSAFRGCKSLQQIHLPDSLLSIQDSAFSECSNLRQINLPPKLATIGRFAFYACRGLETLNKPLGLTTIDTKAFYDCNNLKTLELPHGLTKIGASALRDCAQLTTIVPPSTLKTVGKLAFLGCASPVDAQGFVVVKGTLFDYVGNETHVVIPQEVTKIGERVFLENPALTQVTIHDKVTTIGDSAFSGCANLSHVTLPEGIKIAAGAFAGCPFQPEDQ